MCALNALVPGVVMAAENMTPDEEKLIYALSGCVEQATLLKEQGLANHDFVTAAKYRDIQAEIKKLILRIETTGSNGNGSS
jgi:hypothetical protein